MTKKQLRFTSIIVIVVLFLSFVLYQAVKMSKADIKTQIALKETVYSTIDTKCFVVRDEEYIENSKSGTVVSFAHNGGKVAAGDTVSIVFNNSEDADIYLKKNEIQDEIDHYKELSSQANLHTVDIDSINEKINKELTDYLECVDTCDYQKAIENAELYRNSVTSKQIATGASLDYSKQLVSLQNELAELNKKSISYSEIKSEKSGYYIDGADGYENIIDFDKIDSVTKEDVEKAIKASPKSVDENVAGRNVSNFNWYILTVVDTSKIVNIELGSTLYINFPYSGVEKLPAKVYKIGNRNENKTLLIFECSLMNENLADFRIEDIEIITDEFSGYKVKNTAIRTVDDETGVYVQSGNLINFKKVHIVYSGDDFSLVDNPDGDTDYINMYDSVVYKGVEMYDDKLV